MKFTVLINTYNYASYLSRSIESVLGQNYDRNSVQIIVVDDGSTDNTGVVAARYKDKVRYFKQDNQGQAAAILSGIKQAEGDYICLLDADDWFYENKLSALSEKFRTCPGAGAIYNRYDIVDSEGAILKARQPGNLNTDRLRDRARFWESGGVPTSSISLRSDVARRLSIPTDAFRICADSFILYALPFLCTVESVHESLTAYRLHGKNAFLRLSRAEQLKKHKENAPWIRKGIRSIYGIDLYGAPLEIPQLMEQRRLSEALSAFGRGVNFINEHASKRMLPKQYLKIARCLLLSLRQITATT